MKNIFKNAQKSSNGITLIALVITIIVLLILAGISISMLSGDNGILQRATQSKEETRGGAVQEQRDLWIMEQTSDQYAKNQSFKSLSSLLQELGPNGQKLLTIDEISTINETGQVTIGNRTIVFKEILTIGSEYDKGNIKIGDNLTYTANGYSNWIVFGKDDDGNVLITTAEPVGSYSPTYDAEHWFSWEADLNAQCALYSGTVQGNNVTARSMTLEDVNNAVGFIKPEFTKYTFGTVKDYEHGKVNYYYPSEDATSNIYPYFKKATVDTLTVPEGSADVPAKEFESNTYYYYKNGDNYTLYYNNNGTYEKNTIDLDTNLKRIENLKYVIGDGTNLNPYFLASRSVGVYSSKYSSFACLYIANVYDGYVSCNKGSMCSSDAYRVVTNSGPSDWGIRPIVPVPSSIQVEMTQDGKYDIKK